MLPIFRDDTSSTVRKTNSQPHFHRQISISEPVIPLCCMTSGCANLHQIRICKKHTNKYKDKQEFTITVTHIDVEFHSLMCLFFSPFLQREKNARKKGGVGGKEQEKGAGGKEKKKEKERRKKKGGGGGGKVPEYGFKPAEAHMFSFQIL